jgi:NAD(P)-dependent dehydrogenase (short-subunit alcohol dehydrogenase family)
MVPKNKNSDIYAFYRQLFMPPAPIPDDVNLTGQTGLITGANSGLGFQAALDLLGAKLSHLIITVRSEQKGQETKTSLLEKFTQAHSSLPTPQISVWLLEMESYKNILEVAKRVDQENVILNFAILNAGLAPDHSQKTAETGHEKSIQVNWLGTALLALHLRATLHRQYSANADAFARRPVISIIGSDTARYTPFAERHQALKENKPILTVLDSQPDGTAQPDRYPLSKYLILSFFVEWQRRLPQSNKVLLNIITPGLVWSALDRDVKGIQALVFTAFRYVFAWRTEVGSRSLTGPTVVYPERAHGKYWFPDEEHPLPPIMVEEKELNGKLWGEMAEDFRRQAGVDVEELLR